MEKTSRLILDRGQSFVARIYGLLRLMRWQNCLFAGAATAIGAASVQKHEVADRGELVIVASVIVVLTLAFGNVVNDILDEDLDRHAKPWRPIPSGYVSHWSAVCLCVILFMLSVAGAVLYLQSLLGLVLMMLALAASYSYWLKRVPLVGNVVVALQSGSCFMFGALATGVPNNRTLAGSALIGILFLSYEVAKAIEDQEGDGRADIRTIAHVIGPGGQANLLLGLASMYVGVAILGSISLSVGQGYWSVLVPILPLFVFSLIGRRMSSLEQSSRVTRFIIASKWTWILGLFGLMVLAL